MSHSSSEPNEEGTHGQFLQGDCGGSERVGHFLRPHSKSGWPWERTPGIPGPKPFLLAISCLLILPPLNRFFLGTHTLPRAGLLPLGWSRQWGTWEEPAREPPALNTGKAPPRLYHVPADGCWGQFCSSFKAAEHIRAPRLLCTRGSSVQDKCLAQPRCLVSP